MSVQSRRGLALEVGPFTYEMTPADDWAAQRLEALTHEVAGVRPLSIVGIGGTPMGPSRAATRCCLLLRRAQREGDLRLIVDGQLPADVLALCPEGTPARGWLFSSDDLETETWWHLRSPVCVIAVPPSAAPCPVVLPWPVLVRDAFSVGGGVLHAGLAALDGDGELFLAPPDGGKSTALRRPPAPWSVIGDDAVLVWREGGSWRASPLPTWGYLTGFSAALPGTVPWRLGDSVRVRHAVCLQKRAELALTPIAATAALRDYYRAASEYPAVMRVRRMFVRELFALAAGLARDVPAAVLELPRGAGHWALLQPGRTA